MLRLRDKLGPILWQFPPQLAFDAERFEAFFALLPRDTDAALALARGHDERLAGRAWLEIDRARPLRHAVEIRHPSFIDPAFVALLRRHRIALVVADTAGRWPLLEDLTADFVYLRLHGDKELYASGYDDAALDRWAARIAAWRDGRQVGDARLASQRARPAARAPRRLLLLRQRRQGPRAVRRRAPRGPPRRRDRFGRGRSLRAAAGARAAAAALASFPAPRGRGRALTGARETARAG